MSPFVPTSPKKGEAIAFLLIISPYVLISLLTGLNWNLFRDEVMYMNAVQEALRGNYFTLNIAGFGVFLWKILSQFFGYSPPIFRSSVTLFSFLAIFIFFVFSRRFGAIKPWKYAFFLASLAEFFIYSFQINSLVMGIAFCLLIIQSYLVATSSGEIKEGIFKLNLIALAVFSFAGCITNPFILAYPTVIILNESAKILRKEQIRRARTIICSSACAILLWIVYFFYLGDGFRALQQHGVAGLKHNSSIFGYIYPGHIAMFFVYFGGLFPFLSLVFPRRISFKISLLILLCAFMLIKCFPSQPAESTLPYFHSVFSAFIIFGLKYLGAPSIFYKIIMILLMILGMYNLLGCVSYYKDGTLRFWFFGIPLIYMVGMLIDPYISSRLYIPGLLGLFLLVVRIYENQPALLCLQLAYQLFILVFYSYGLYSKYGFLSIS